jgi:TonB family protein
MFFSLVALATAPAAQPAPAAKPADLKVEMGLPILGSWVAPAYPKEAADRKLEGRVQVRLVIDESGVVTQARALRSTDKIFDEAAVQAARQWRFEPATEDGKKVPKCIDVTLPFQLADLKGKPESSTTRARVLQSLLYAPTTPAAKKTGEDPDYPDSLLSRHLPGMVVVDFSVDTEGRLQGLNILAATHSDFVQPALAAAEKWSFRPARQGDLAVAAPMKGTLEFTVLDVAHIDILAANGVSLGKAPTNDPDIESLDQKPEILVAVDPVYPYDLLLAGTEGEAVADFLIQADGRVDGVTVREATRPEFGRALTAALECWVFRPAHKDGGNVPVPAAKRQKFSLADADGTRPAATRLIERLRSNDTEGMGARGLDKRLNPRYRDPPAYPAKLLGDKMTGEAEIAFIIDREGRGRVARIVSATQEEFGWAAATAVERWVFDPPKRGGQPTDVRVTIPFKFDPPK